ncbi:MAG: hypothetical protein ACREYE_18080, partial [Gammaproteobacteria bacterium]
RRVCPSSTHGVDRLNDHPNLDFGAQHARYGSGVQPKSDRLLATALVVMGREKGVQFSERRGLAVLFVSRDQNRLHEDMSTRFRSAIVQ